MKTWKLSALLVCAPALASAQSPFMPCTDHSECGSFEACIDETCTPVMPSDTPCASDDDCGGGACLDGICWMPEGGGSDPGTPTDPAIECADDADCPEGMLCEEGYCFGGIDPEDIPGSCTQDAECPEGEMCVACYCMPTEGTCRADADCPAGQRCDLVSVGSAGGSPDGGGEPVVCEGSYGFCAIDISQVEPNPACGPFCDAVIACGGGDDSEVVDSEDGGSASGESGEAEGTESSEAGLSEDAEECIGYCSYLLTDADAGAAMQSLVDCVAAHAAESCDDIAAACEGEAEAVGGAAEDIPAGAERDDSQSSNDEPGSGGGDEAEPTSAGGLFEHAFGGGEEGGDGSGDGDGNGSGNGADGGVGGEASGEGDSSGGGCSVSGVRTPAALGLFLVALGGLGLSRRRRRAI